MSGCKDSEKWNGIYASGDHGKPQAARVLQENLHLLPASGTALDLACGLGSNALLLARHGLDTSAWDLSQTAIERLQSHAEDAGIRVQAQTRDVTISPPAMASFDVIVVSRFLDRSLTPHLVAALRGKGLIFYQTFIADKTGDSGPRNPAYLLKPNELLHMFRSLQIIFYREEGSIGDRSRGFRNEAMLVGCRTESHG